MGTQEVWGRLPAKYGRQQNGEESRGRRPLRGPNVMEESEARDVEGRREGDGWRENKRTGEKRGGKRREGGTT